MYTVYFLLNAIIDRAEQYYSLRTRETNMDADDFPVIRRRLNILFYIIIIAAYVVVLLHLHTTQWPWTYD